MQSKKETLNVSTILEESKMCEKLLVRAFTIQFFVYCNAYMENYTDLMKQYYLLCGPEYFCLPQSKTHQWELSSNLSYRHLDVCPECQCDKECIKRGDCCADLYFSFPDLKCVNRTIINGRYYKEDAEQSSALMVTSCPMDSNNDLKEKCTGLNDTKSRLGNFPVTGTLVPLTYYNKYCAECHGVENYTVWTLDIDCSLFADFNFLSTLDEVIEAAYFSECIFQAFREDTVSGELKQDNCFDIDEKQTLFTKCNQTGEWLIYDPNIAYACESFYKRKYRIFKNIFCYICNPSDRTLHTKDISSSCNVTGQWETYDSGLQEACLNLPQTSATFPFKNIFCYLCNRGNDSSQIFVDVIGNFMEFPIEDSYFHFQYHLNISDFNLEFFIHDSKKKIEKDRTLGKTIHNPFELESFRTNEGSVINMTNLLLQKAAMRFGGDIRVCNSRALLFPKGITSNCTCEISCVFDITNLDCCEDLSIQVPIHCLNTLEYHPFSVQRKKGLPTLNGCFQAATLNLIKKGCTLPEPNDIYSHIPLTKSNGVNYDNFYCALCNSYSEEFVMQMRGHFSNLNLPKNSNVTVDYFQTDKYLNSKNEFSIWSLEMVCPRYIDYSHYLKAGDLIEIAKRMKCRIRFNKETEGLNYCLLSNRAKMRCADQSNWTYSDTDVEWACNNFINYQLYHAIFLQENLPKKFDTLEEKNYRTQSIYTNIFCALCKPNRTYPEYFVDNCTIDVSSYFCFYYPRIYYYYPFKNIHCARCNDINFHREADSDSDLDLDSYNHVAGVNWFPVLRNMFSISGDDNVEATTIGQCESNQVYDQYKNLCRNITCYSGKNLVNKQCVPLFQRTMNLQYSMSFTAKLNRIKERISNATYTSMGEYFTQEIYRHFVFKQKILPDVKEVTIDQYGRENGKNVTNCMLITMEIFFGSSVPRIHIEKSLIKLRRSFEDSCDRNFTESNEKDLIEIDTTFAKRKRFIEEPLFFDYFSAKVSNTLFCPQIELHEDEYNTSDGRSELFLTRHGFKNITILSDEFALTPYWRMRVCLAYLQKINYIPISETDDTIPVDIQKKYLWILSLGSSVLSMVCLSLGLICYLMLPSLRTIPGKLMILLMTSLLFTLMLLQISYFAVQMEYGCIAVSIILHYAWMSVFTCTQTANFHMWRTFTSIEVESGSPSNIFVKYLAYILGIPTGLVLTNVTLGVLLYSDPFRGYGGSNCFIRNVYLLIALFICPVALICFTNVIFFSLTARAIRMTPTASSNQRKRNELLIFARLTTVTGVSWLLQIIDSFLPLSIFTFISTIINSLQGLFIFIAFIVNKRIWGLLRNRLCPPDNGETQSQNITSFRKTTTNFD